MNSNEKLTNEIESVLDKHARDLEAFYEEEKLIDQKNTADALGMIDYARFLEYKECVVNGLMIFGNKFQEALGMALSEAEDKDAVRIIRSWPNECGVHEMLYKMHVAKQIALDAQIPPDETI